MDLKEYSQLEEKKVSYLKIFWTFFRIGCFTLGGGLAMTTVMRHELVLKSKYIKDEDFLAEMSVATFVPGAIAVNMAYLQGRRLHGKIGAFMAISGVILPSFFTILFIACFALPYFKHYKIAAFFRGCAIAVVAQLAFGVFVFGRQLLRNGRNILVCIIAFGFAIIPGVHPIFAIIIAGVLGYLFCQKKDNPVQKMEL